MATMMPPSRESRGKSPRLLPVADLGANEQLRVLGAGSLCALGARHADEFFAIL
jgi:hypothetical protein